MLVLASRPTPRQRIMELIEPAIAEAEAQIMALQYPTSGSTEAVVLAAFRGWLEERGMSK